MTTFKAAIRRAVEIAGRDFGIVVPIDALTTTTVTVNLLKIGQSPADYANQFMYRFDAASAPADSVRQVSAFDGSTGILTHAGANYGDTTATSEYLFLSFCDPFTLRYGAQETLRQSKRVHWDTFPASGVDRYYLDQFPWIQRKGDIARLLRRRGPFLGRNARFDDWNTVSTAGALEPDLWALSGAAATWTRSTTNPFRGAYELALTRAGTDAVVRQFVVGKANADGRSLLHNGVDSLRGETVTLLLICRSGTASRLKGFIDDGVTVTATAFHTGGGLNEELTISATIDAAAVEVSFGFQVVTGDMTGYVSECHLVHASAIDDTIRRDVYQRDETKWDFEEGATPRIRPETVAAIGECYEIATYRPYATLDETRLWAGTADGDSIDIPVDLWATGILAQAFNAYRDRHEKFGALAAEYGNRWTALRLAGMTDERPLNQLRSPGPAGRAGRL